jgi:DNA-binding YbaB/EbfC family protein
MFDPGMLRRLQKDLQDRMEKMKEDLKTKYVEGSAGGGVVTVVANGNQEIHEVRIKAAAIDPEDPEMLQDLILAATNQALEKSRQLNEDAVAGITGGLRLPGFF